MEFSIRILLMALLAFAIVLILIMFVTSMSSGSQQAVGNFYDWTKGLIGVGQQAASAK